MPPGPEMKIATSNLEKTSPETELGLAARRRPSPFTPTVSPARWTIGVVPAPGWVKPSIVTGSVISGSSDVGEIVTGPEPMAKRIVSAPPPALAS